MAIFWNQKTKKLIIPFIFYVVILVLIWFAPILFPNTILRAYASLEIILSLSLAVRIVADIYENVVRLSAANYLGRMLANIATMIALLGLVIIFPFNMLSIVAVIFRMALWLGIIAFLVLILIDFIDIFRKNKLENDK